MVDQNQRLEFLKKIHLFKGLSDEQMNFVASELQEVGLPAETLLFKQGSQADNFYLIYSGQVRVTRLRDQAVQTLATLVAGDYFGEEALIMHGSRTATVTLVEDCLLLALSRRVFEGLLKQAPHLRHNVEIAISSRRLARRMRFKWLQEDEVIYFLARKHPIVLYQNLIGPLLSVLFPLILLILAWWTASDTPIYLAAVSLVGILAWAGWRALDWNNDFYIVTNQRAIWLEKVIGVYDSRQEAPLSTLLSVGVETDLFGRMLDYGNLIVRTFVGRIIFHDVSHPYQAAALVEEHWNRTKAAGRKDEVEAMKQALRQKLGLAGEAQTRTDAPTTQVNVPTPYRPNLLMVLSRNVFKVRFEAGGTITYRKHLIVLLKQAWVPTLFFLILVAGLVAHLVTLGQSPQAALITISPQGWRVDTLFLVLLILMIPFILWWLYEYLDWSNDIFQVTSDQILDIDRKPFGTEERRSAPLENILSTEYKRIGMLGYLFNFGTVFITVGGTQLAFEDVFDPAMVQQDIDRRRMARQSARKTTEMDSDRQRMADWLATYHRSAEELRQLEQLKEPPQESE